MYEKSASFSDKPQLEAAIKLFQNEPTPENEDRFFAVLKRVKFLVPCGPQDGEVNKKFHLAVLTTQEGEKFLPAFSEAAEFGKWPFAPERTEILSFDELKHIAVDDPQNLAGITLNPFGSAILLRQKQIAYIDSRTEGMSVQRAEHDTQMQLLQPKCIPPGLTDGLQVFFSRRAEVFRAYLLLAQEHKQSAPQRKAPQCQASRTPPRRAFRPYPAFAPYRRR